MHKSFLRRVYPEKTSRMMAANSLQLGFKLTGAEIGFPPISALRRMQVLEPETGGFRSLSHPGATVWCAKSHAHCGQEARVKLLNQDSFAYPTQWWDNKLRRPTPWHSDFKHKKSRVSLLQNNRCKPPWGASQLVMLDDVGVCRNLCDDGRIAEAVEALDLLVQRGTCVSTTLFYHLLKRCKDLILGRRIHSLTVKSGYERDAFLATHLIGLYASYGRLDEAMQAFTMVSTPDAYNWATIIFAYARHGEAAQAVRLYRQMRESTTVKPTDHIYVAVLKACATVGDLVVGKEIHAHILASPGKHDSFVHTGLVHMYVNCGSLENARSVFDTLLDRNVVTWNAMIAGYAQQGMGQESLNLYRSMQQESLIPPDSVTYVCLLQACACAGTGALDQGKQLHAQIEKGGLQEDVVLGGSLVNMYAKCGSLGDARSLFDRLPARNVVTWNAMIAGYAQQEMGQEAIILYSSMQEEGLTPPDSVAFLCLLQACASVGEGALDQGKQLHAQIVEQGLQDDVVLGGSLVNMYAKCGGLEDARSLFNRLPCRNVFTWTAMIAGYAQQHMGHEAFSLYCTMQQEGITTPNFVTFACLLQACASVGALPWGKELHAQIEQQGLQADLVVGTALVNMYAKCGSMFDSRHVFDSLRERSVEAWNALIGGYTRQGNYEIVFDLLDRMRLDSTQPDGVTFLNVLAVCSHGGLVDKGQKFFEAMKIEHGISPTVEHYTCMMDLLGRSGQLDEALKIAKTMPFPPNSAVWRTLLGACRKWNNIEIGQQAFQFAVSLDAKDASPYVLMSNVYASSDMWEKADGLQERRVKLGAWKKPGQSWWNDIGGLVHTFIGGDKTHSQSEISGVTQSAENLLEGRIFSDEMSVLTVPA